MLAVTRGANLQGMWATAAVSLVSWLLADSIAATLAGQSTTTLASLIAAASPTWHLRSKLLDVRPCSPACVTEALIRSYPYRTARRPCYDESGRPKRRMESRYPHQRLLLVSMDVVLQ